MNAANQDDFQSTISRLWQRLGMQPPRFVEPGRVQLRVEGIGLDLLDTGRGILNIEGVVDGLASDPLVRTRQTRRILETNLGMLLTNESGVYLKAQPSGQTALVVRASYSYQGTLDRLVKKIEDTLQTMEYYLAEFKSTAALPVRRGASAPASGEAAVIFRP